MKILLLDNYDSFTYNLYHYLEQFCDDITVARNNEITPEETDGFTHIVLSPGPGLPKESGNLIAIIGRQLKLKPILGVCLGMQAIAEHCGGELYNQQVVRHGITTEIETTKGSKLFSGLPTAFKVGLYHSWAVNEASLGNEFQVTAKSTEGVVMAIEHQKYPVAGVQFHPESILTEHGQEILYNWIKATQL